jgi:hypothetical protein
MATKVAVITQPNSLSKNFGVWTTGRVPLVLSTSGWGELSGPPNAAGLAKSIAAVEDRSCCSSLEAVSPLEATRLFGAVQNGQLAAWTSNQDPQYLHGRTSSMLEPSGRISVPGSLPCGCGGRNAGEPVASGLP